MFTRAFFKLFPVPTFLDIPYAGLEIADDAVRILQFVKGAHGLRIAKHGFRELAPGMIDAGYIKDEPGVIKILSELLKELGVTYVRASLPEEKIYLFKTDAVGNDSKEIRQNIEFKLEENVPLSPADALFSYDLNSESVQGKRQASVFVAPRKVVDAYMNVIRGAGAIPLSFEVEARSLARTFTPKENPDVEIIIHIMKQKTGIYLICNGVVSFTSTVPWGGTMVTSAIAQAFSVSNEEAEAIKKKAGYHDAEETKKIFSAIQDSIGAIQKEVAKVYTFWMEHSEACRDVDRIVLSGLDGLLVGLASHISPDPKIPVVVGDAWTNAFSHNHYIPPISHDESLDYAVVAGLALPY